MQNRLIKLIPGAPAAQAQLTTWRDQLQDLRPLFPIVIPYLLWVFVRSYNQEQERIRQDRLAPILRPEKRLPKDRPAK
jgi:hypothetical protein